MTKALLLPAFSLGLLLSSATITVAQDSDSNSSDQVSNNRFWEAKLPGGSYMVALSRIASISMHSYTVKGAMVHEVAIETTGSALTRIYAIEALGENSDSNIAQNLIKRGREIGKQVGDRTGVDINTAVHKEYPVTTHAKTIEYRVVDKADLNQIYKSLSKAWRSNKGRKITIK